LKNAYSLRFSRRSGRFEYHPVTYVARRLSRNILHAIDVRAVRDQSRKSAGDLGIEQLSIETRSARDLFFLFIAIDHAGFIAP
jgi:hypothetical protein